MTKAQIRDQNPWWDAVDWHERDPDMRAAAASPAVGEDPLSGVPFFRPTVHVIRGPRQVGKTTALKRLIGREIEAGREPRSLIYLDFERRRGGRGKGGGKGAGRAAAQDDGDVYDSVLRAKEIAGAEGPYLVVLDGLGAVKGWEFGVKALWDHGTLRRDAVACVASLAGGTVEPIDDPLSGRRGVGRDLLIMPHSFADVAQAAIPDLPASPQFDLHRIFSEPGRDVVAGLQPHSAALEELFERYIIFGGTPPAVAEMLGGAASPSDEIKRRMLDPYLAGFVSELGVSPEIAKSLLVTVARRLGAQVGWKSLTEDLDEGDGRPGRSVVRAAVEFAVDTYFLALIPYWRWKTRGYTESRHKKIYFIDPLLATASVDLAGDLTDHTEAMVESTLGVHLLRRHESDRVILETPNAVEHLHVWGRGSPEEIDFVAGPWEDRAAMGVHYAPLRLTEPLKVDRAHPGSPAMVASRDQLVVDRPLYVVAPAATVAWALGT